MSVPTRPTTREEIMTEIVRTMAETFELDPAEIKPEVNLFEDLDLDSIDAIDMAVKMQDISGKRIGEEALKELRTVSDVVDLMERLIKEG